MGDIGLCFRVVLGIAHQHADPPNPLRLLRTPRERPRRCAADERDELAPFLRALKRLDLGKLRQTRTG
jgi:hypothetical protein